MLLLPWAMANYEPDSHWVLAASYRHDWQPYDLASVNDAPLFRSYISLSRGLGRMEHTLSHSLTSSLRYRDVLSGFFAGLSGSYSDSRHRPLYESTVAGDLRISTPTGHYTNSQNYAIEAEASKAFDVARLTAKLSGRHAWNNYNVLLGGVLTPCQLRTANVAADVSLQPTPWLSFEHTSAYAYSIQEQRHGAASQEPLHTFSHKLRIFVMPGSWQLRWTNEFYHSNDPSVSTNVFSDLSLTYRHKRYEVGLYAYNIFGNRNYERRYVATTYESFTVNRLRPRELLARVYFNF